MPLSAGELRNGDENVRPESRCDGNSADMECEPSSGSKGGQHDASRPSGEEAEQERSPSEDMLTDRERRRAERGERRIRAAKREVRSELSVSKGEWRKKEMAKVNLYAMPGGVDNCPRVHAAHLSTEEFIEQYERPCKPVVIKGLMDDWPANETWTWDKLLEKYPDHRFKVGSDDDGYAVRLKLKYYLQYMKSAKHRKDDSPLYIFDGTFADRRGSKSLKHDYSLPKFFTEDLFQYVGESRRPPYRWVVWGPPRSGSSLHIDPLATSAWNALLRGRKRWCLFPPGVPRSQVKPKMEGLDSEAVCWFAKVYPLTQREDWAGPAPLEIIQEPGETVFVPAGWWHAVLNMEDSIAVTHNFVNTANFPNVWKHTKKSRPGMAVKWLARLREVRPDLAAVADSLRDEEAHSASSPSSTSSSSSSSSSDDDDAASASHSSGDEDRDERASKRSKSAEQPSSAPRGGSPSGREQGSPSGAAAAGAAEGEGLGAGGEARRRGSGFWAVPSNGIPRCSQG